eukprot:gene3151-3681_t
MYAPEGPTPGAPGDRPVGSRCGVAVGWLAAALVVLAVP